MKKIRGKLTYANVVSSLCLFLLLGGGAAFAAGQLAKNSVGTKQIKNGAVTGAKIKNGAVTGAKIDLRSIGTVPSAANASHADNAGHADSAVNAVNATNATNAVHAQTADTAASANAIAAPEALRVVGQPGQPTFQGNWKDSSPQFFPEAAFYLDREGVVHLQGTVESNNTTELIFTLPPGYRPAKETVFPAVGNGGAPTYLVISPSGQLIAGDKSVMQLNGITFRAGQ